MDDLQGGPSARAKAWAATMAGQLADGDVIVAHADSSARVTEGPGEGIDRLTREREQAAGLAPLATRAEGAGRRARAEEADTWRTCFERDRDRILHSASFRRLAGKTQVFVFPEDHMRTRLTHALEVAQVAAGIARACGLNVALAEAIALGHDCGHGPGGHASEDAFDRYVEGGFDHAPWGADVSLADLNLCAETLDGIRNHSWSRPAPSTPEGEVVSWADRIAYVCHDFEDAVDAGIVSQGSLPSLVKERCGTERGEQLGSFIDAMVATTLATGRVGMHPDLAEALAAFRAFNYEAIYQRDVSITQGKQVVDLLCGLVEFFADRPNLIPDVSRRGGLETSGRSALEESVAYVAGMTDRFAFRAARQHLDWPDHAMPQGIDR